MRLRPPVLGGVTDALATALAVSTPRAAPERPVDAFNLLQEEQTVTGATKRARPLSETPSAVSVITAAEIRAMGYHTVADALRWVRGLFVTSDRNYSYLGVRGLQRPGDYNNKVLLAIDGHTLNGNVFGDALIGDELGFDLEQVERIEVVRGPGSTLYGSHAVLAVVNVVTRRPSALPALAAAGRLGGPGERRAFGLLAGTRPNGLEILLSGSLSEAEGQDFYYPEFDAPSTSYGRADGVDGVRGWALFGSARWAGWTLLVKANRREKVVPTAAYGTVFGDPRNETRDGHDLIELSRTRSLAPTVELTARAYWDASRYQGHYVYDYGGSSPVVNDDAAEGDVAGTEWRVNWSAGPRHALTAGFEAQRRVRARIYNADVEPPVLYMDRDFPASRGAVYLQDEVRVHHGLRATAGARVDGDQHLAPVVSPRLDVWWRVRPGTTWKLLAGTAFRAPSPYERYYDDGYSQLPNPGLEPERAITLETAVEQQLGPMVANLSGHVTRVRDLIDLVPAPMAGALVYTNSREARSGGLECELSWLPSAATRIRTAAAWQRSVDHESGAELTNSPRWNAHAVLTHESPDGRLTLGFGARYLAPRVTLGGDRTDAALVADARTGLRLGPQATLALQVRNLFDARFGDPGSEEHAQDQIAQDGRLVYVNLEWRRIGRP